MATIRKELQLNAGVDAVWSAVRDFQAVHTRLVPGFVRAVQPEAGARVVTFANGNVARELLVTCDDEARRLVYAAVSPRVQHHNASVSVVAEAGGGCRLVWITDVLPDGLSGYIAEQMGQAGEVMKRTLEGSVGSGTGQGA